MITELDQLADRASLAADVCIVGAGAAGPMIAREFLGTATQVVLIESGGWTARGETQDLYARAVEQPSRGLQAGRARVFGGTTTLWGGQCIELDRIDFDADGLGSVHGMLIRQPDLGQRFRAELAAAANIRVLLHAGATRLDTGVSGTQIRRVAFRSISGRTGQVGAKRVLPCAGSIDSARLLLPSQATSETAAQDHPRAQGPHADGLGSSRGLVGRFLQAPACGRAAEVVAVNSRRLWGNLAQEAAPARLGAAMALAGAAGP